MAISVLGLAGSPRQGGNTETLLDWALAAAAGGGAKVTKFRLCDLVIHQCQACEGCFDDGSCVQEDGMQMLYPHLREADSIVFAAPIYAMGIPSHAKAVADRCQPFWAMKYVRHERVTLPGKPERLGAFLSCSGGDRPRAFEGAELVVRYMFHVLEVRLVGRLLCPNVDLRGDIFKQPHLRALAEDLGAKLAAPR